MSWANHRCVMTSSKCTGFVRFIRFVAFVHAADQKPSHSQSISRVTNETKTDGKAPLAKHEVNTMRRATNVWLRHVLLLQVVAYVIAGSVQQLVVGLNYLNSNSTLRVMHVAKKSSPHNPLSTFRGIRFPNTTFEGFAYIAKAGGHEFCGLVRDNNWCCEGKPYTERLKTTLPFDNSSFFDTVTPGSVVFAVGNSFFSQLFLPVPCLPTARVWSIRQPAADYYPQAWHAIPRDYTVPVMRTSVGTDSDSACQIL